MALDYLRRLPVEVLARVRVDEHRDAAAGGEVPQRVLRRGGRHLSPGRHCHPTLSLTVIDCHYLGIYTLMLLALLALLALLSLSISAKMTVSPTQMAIVAPDVQVRF